MVGNLWIKLIIFPICFRKPDKISLIESKLSEFTGKEKSLIFSGGFLMNSTLIPTLTGNNLGQRNKVEIFSDKLNHASINYGCYLTRQKIYRYNHLDLNHLNDLLKKTKKKFQNLL